MKRMIICIPILLCLSLALYSMEKKPTEGILITNQNYTYIFDTPDGTVVDSIINRPDLDQLYVVVIDKIKCDWLKIEAYVPIDKTPQCHKGWVSRGTIGIYLKDFVKVVLYEHPDKGAKIKNILEDPDWGPYTVYDTKNGWLLIEYTYKGENQQGWLPAANQSSNPYTIEN